MSLAAARPVVRAAAWMTGTLASFAAMAVAGRERAVRDFSYDVLARKLALSLGALAE